MDGMLSQDEINALLSGMDEAQNGTAAVAHAETLSLSDMEKDAIGEVANISMGTSATTLYSLVNRKVSITTPHVTLSQWSDIVTNYEKPCVFIQIRYTNGLDGTNILVLKESDVKVITDLMMGGDGTNTEGELGELHLSAISEAMNQMMGSAATSLSSMLDQMIDISPPEATLISMDNPNEVSKLADFLKETFVKISFRMQIDDLVDSTIMQLYPIDFAKSLVENFMKKQMGDEQELESPPEGATSAAPASQQEAQMNAQQQMSANMQQPQMGMNMQPQMGMNMQPQMGMNMQPQMGMMGMPQMQQMPMMGNMNIQQAQFQNFATDFSAIPGQENIELIKDVPLEVTVELGRTTKSIAEILDFAPGTIIELDKIAGEPIDVLVNGKFVARGEVVVIEESFGIRVTEIIKQNI